MTKRCSQRWIDLGYQSRFRLVSSLKTGGAIDQTRLLVVRLQNSIADSWKWHDLPEQTSPRPMGNLLIPFGLLPREVKRQTRSKQNRPGPNSLSEPMPNATGAWITTPHGNRRLQSDELAKGLGVD